MIGIDIVVELGLEQKFKVIGSANPFVIKEEYPIGFS